EIEDKNLSVFAAVDPAMGKERGDYSVIATGYRNDDTGVLYVHDVFMERCHPDILIERLEELTLDYQYDGIAAEAQAMQEFLVDQIRARLQAAGYPAHTRMKYIKHRTRKELRIEALLPNIQNGKIRFSRRLRNSAAMEQFEMYPMHANDDFPDAVSMLTMVATERQASVRTVRRMNRWH